MKFQNLDFKSLALEHGEKIVLGLVALLLLPALWKTQWKTYDKTPEEIVTKVRNVRTSIAQSQWPVEELNQFIPGIEPRQFEVILADNRKWEQYFATHNLLAEKIKNMLQPVQGDIARSPGLAYSISPTWPLYAKDKLLERPELYPVQKLVATHVRMVLAMKPAVSTQDLPEKKAGKSKKSPFRGTGSDTRKPRFKVRGRNEDQGTDSPDGNGAPLGSRNGDDNSPADDNEVPGEGSGETDGPAGQEAQGFHVVAVRGVVPIRKQLRAYEKALHLPLGQDPRKVIDIFDFVLERSVSSDGGRTWSNWQPVDVEKNAKFLFYEVADLETDVVKRGITHPVITSPLPHRLLLEWGEEATHPDITNYVLSPEGREKQRQLEELIARQAEQLRQRRRERMAGGFSGVVRDLGSEAEDIMDDPTATQQLDRSLQSRFNPDGDPTANLKIKQMRQEITAVGDLLLFRYFDFDVLPGLSYRYRVRLKLRNPLYQQLVDKVNPDYQKDVNKEFLYTPYSTPMYAPNDKEQKHPLNQVTIPTDVHVFVQRVDQRHTLRLDEPEITMQVFQWFRKPGTTIAGYLKKLRPGQYIAGEDPKTMVLDPGKQTLVKETPARFLQDEQGRLSRKLVLLDARDGFRGLGTQHLKELGLLRSGGRINVPDEVVVVDDYGKLMQLDPVSQQPQQRILQEEQDLIAKAFKDWEKKTGGKAETEDGDGTRDASEFDMMDDTGEEEGGRRKRRGRRRTPRSSTIKRKTYGGGGT